MRAWRKLYNFIDAVCDCSWDFGSAIGLPNPRGRPKWPLFSVSKDQTLTPQPAHPAVLL